MSRDVRFSFQFLKSPKPSRSTQTAETKIDDEQHSRSSGSSYNEVRFTSERYGVSNMPYARHLAGVKLCQTPSLWTMMHRPACYSQVSSNAAVSRRALPGLSP